MTNRHEPPRTAGGAFDELPRSILAPLKGAIIRRFVDCRSNSGDELPNCGASSTRRGRTKKALPEFVALIDTREQNPLPFADGFPTARATLYPGDYSVGGLRHLFVIEKKDCADLIGTLFGKSPKADGSTMPRLQKFVEELTAMKDIPFRAVVVTEPLRKIVDHLYQSSVPPQNVIRLIADIEVATGVPFKFFDSAHQAAMFVAAEMIQAWEFAHGLSSIKYTIRKLRPERLHRKRVDCPPPPKRI